MRKLIALLLAVLMGTLSGCGGPEAPGIAPPEDAAPVEKPQPEAPREPAAQSNILEEGICGEGILWSLDRDGTLSLRGSGAIPDYEKGAGNQPWYSRRKSVTALVIEAGITRIGDRAFQNCGQLKTAVIGPDVTEIGLWAFQNCYALTEVQLDPNVRLDTGAFRSTPVEWDITAVDSPLYRQSKYYAALSAVELTGNYREDVIAIALSQLGYHEGSSEQDYGGGAKGSKDYTEYGRYMGSVGAAWCSEFACWCIRKAGVPMTAVANSRAANVESFTSGSTAQFYAWDQTVYGGGSYQPRPGDLLLWAWDSKSHGTDENLSHTSLLRSAEVRSDGSLIIHSIDGNSDNNVAERQYRLNSASGVLLEGVGRLYYIVSPDY